MKLKKLDQEFSVCKVEDYSLVDLSAEYSFIGKTDEENSLVCATGDAPSNVVERDDRWRGFRIQGMLDFPLIGILAGIAETLAGNGISIFAISTYNTDYVLVKKESYQRALDILERAIRNRRVTAAPSPGQRLCGAPAPHVGGHGGVSIS